jgi:predicted membrane protein
VQKKTKKLALHRETLTKLNQESLSLAAGAISNAVICRSDTVIVISDVPGGCNIYTPFC